MTLFPTFLEKGRTSSLLQCCLSQDQEKASIEGYDFLLNPQVYVSHQISVDRRLQVGLRSNDRLDILVDGPHLAEKGKGLSGTKAKADVYRCYGILRDTEVLFRALICLASLNSILGGRDYDEGTRRRCTSSPSAPVGDGKVSEELAWRFILSCSGVARIVMSFSKNRARKAIKLNKLHL